MRGIQVFGYMTCRASISDVSKDRRALTFSVKKAARLTLYCASLTLLELRAQRHRLEGMHPSTTSLRTSDLATKLLSIGDRCGVSSPAVVTCVPVVRSRRLLRPW